MGTKKVTTSSTAFDPSSMGRYQGWQGSMFNTLSGLANNPFSNPFFNLNTQFQTKAASALAGRNMGNATLNFLRSGIGGGSLGSGAFGQLLSGLNRMGSGMQFQGFQNAVNQANTDRWNAMSLGSSLFQPLVTGGTQTQRTSGVGTWLPQVLGGAAAIGLAPFTGGTSLLGLAGMAGKGGGGADPGGGFPGMAPSSGSPFGGGFSPGGLFGGYTGGGSPFGTTFGGGGFAGAAPGAGSLYGMGFPAMPGGDTGFMPQNPFIPSGSQ